MLKNILGSTAKIIFVLVAFVVLLILNWKMWSKDQEQEKTIVNLQKELVIQQQENAKMIGSNAQLRRRIDSLKRGSVEMIEEEARDNFGMVGEGETFYDFKSSK